MDRKSSWEQTLENLPIFIKPPDTPGDTSSEDIELFDPNKESLRSRASSHGVVEVFGGSDDDVEIFQPGGSKTEHKDSRHGIVDVSDDCDDDIEIFQPGRNDKKLKDNTSSFSGEIVSGNEETMESRMDPVGSDDDDIQLFEPEGSYKQMAHGASGSDESDCEIIVLGDDDNMAGASDSDMNGSVMSFGGEVYPLDDVKIANENNKNEHPDPLSGRRSSLAPAAEISIIVTSIRACILSVDQIIHKVFNLLPVCRTYLHWRHILLRVWEETMDTKRTTKGQRSLVKDPTMQTLQGLEEIAIAFREAESKWNDIKEQLDLEFRGTPGSTPGTPVRKRTIYNKNKAARARGTCYSHISLDDDTHPEKAELANLERLIYSQLNATLKGTEDTNEESVQSEDDEAGLFWWRFFGVRTEEVPLKMFCRALSLYLRHEFSQFIGSEKTLFDMVRLTVDTGSEATLKDASKSNDNIVSVNEFREFVSRYGPLKSCFNNMRGVCVVDTKRAEIGAAEWFYPYDRQETEALLKYGKQGQASREWVARLGWRHKSMAFVFSYMDKKFVKHTPVTHHYKQEEGNHMYEIELQHKKMSGLSMRHLILNVCGRNQERTPIFGANVAAERKKAEDEDRKWINYLSGLKKRQLNKSKVSAIAEGFEEVFELNTFFEDFGALRNKMEGGGDRHDKTMGRKQSVGEIRESMLETKEGRELLKWMRSTCQKIHKNIQQLTSASVGERKRALRSLQHLTMAAASSNSNLDAKETKKLERLNPFAKNSSKSDEEEKAAMERQGRLKHYQWAFNDYKREGQKVIHDLVEAATSLLGTKGLSNDRELIEAFHNVLSIIQSLSITGVPMHMRNDSGATPVEIVVSWFANHRDKASKGGSLSMVGIQLFHDLFTTVYERTTCDLDANAMGDRVLNELTHKSILVKVFRGIIPQGDIEIIEYLVKHDKRLKHMLRHEIKKERNIFLSLGLNAEDNNKTNPIMANSDHKNASLSDTDSQTGQVSFLHYLIHETANNHMDTHFDAYANAPRIAKLVFAELPPQKKGVYLSLPGGENNDTPILAAARANHGPMFLFLLHLGTMLRRDAAQGEPTEDIKRVASPGSAYKIPSRVSSERGWGRAPSNMSFSMAQLEESITILGTPICEMIDRQGNCLLHFLANAPNITLREVSMVLCSLDNAFENTNAMVVRLNTKGETPLSLLLSRYKELSSSNATAGGIQATELANISLLLLARGARSQGLRQDELDVLAELVEAAMIRCVNYRWTIMKNAVLFGDDRLVDLIFSSKSVRTSPFLKHPRFESRKHQLKKRRKERAAKILTQATQKRFSKLTAKSHQTGFTPHAHVFGHNGKPGFPKNAWPQNQRSLRDIRIDDRNVGRLPAKMTGNWDNNPFVGISDHTLLHVATSSPHSSAKIVERLFRQDQVISEGKFRGRLKELVVTPEDVERQLEHSTNRNSYDTRGVSMKPGMATQTGSSLYRHLNSFQGVTQTEEKNLLRLGLNLADDSEKNPLHYIASKQNTQTRSIAKLLVENSVNIVHMDAEGLTPLHVAAKANQLEIVDIMVNTHMHLDIKTGRVQDDYAVYQNALKQMEGTLARVNDKHDRTALFFAVEQGNWQICSLLLARKAQVDEFDSQGKTALTVAFQCRYGRLTDENLYTTMIETLEAWISFLESQRRLSLVQKRSMLRKCELWTRMKSKVEREYSVIDPENRIREILTTLQQSILHAKAIDENRLDEVTSAVHADGTLPVASKESTNKGSTIDTKHHKLTLTGLSPEARDSKHFNFGDESEKMELKANETDQTKNSGAGRHFDIFNTEMHPLKKLKNQGLGSSWRLANASQMEDLLDTFMEAKAAIEAERSRTGPLKTNLKVTIDVLLNHGADIDLAFRLVTMDVADCIDILEEFTSIELKFKEIEREAEEAFKLVMDAELPTHLDHTYTFLKKKEQAFTDEVEAMPKQNNALPMTSVKTWGRNNNNKDLNPTVSEQLLNGRTSPRDNNRYRVRTRASLLDRLKKARQYEEDVDAKQTAIEERRDAVFRLKYNQIVIKEKYKGTIERARRGELWWYLLFLGFTTYVGIHTASRNNKASFFFREGAISTLLEDEIPYSISTLRRNFIDIDSLDEFYMWSKGPFLDVFYPETRAQYYDGSVLKDREPTYLGQGRIIGVPRWRQQRWSSVDCNLFPRYAALGDVCTDTIDPWPWIPVLSHTGSTQSFGNSWTYADPPGAFSYTWASGTNRWYPGGGYIQEFPSTENTTMIMDGGESVSAARIAALALINKLINDTWVDSFTRVLFVEFNVYNANEDVWMISHLQIEFPNTGGVRPSSTFDVLTEITWPLKPPSISIWVLKGIVLTFAIINFVSWSIDFCFLGRKYNVHRSSNLNIETFFNYVEIFINAFWALVILSQVGLLMKTVPIDFSTQDRFIDMSEIGFLGNGYLNFFSILLFLLWVKLTDYLSVKREISRLVVMIMVLLSELRYLLAFMFIMWVAFGTGTFVAYGYRGDDTALWITSLLTTISNAFNGADIINDKETAPFMGTFYGILSLIFILLVLMNLVIAILTAAYENAREEVGDAYWARHQYQLVQQYTATMSSKPGDSMHNLHKMKRWKLLCNECFDMVVQTCMLVCCSSSLLLRWKKGNSNEEELGDSERGRVDDEDEDAREENIKRMKRRTSILEELNSGHLTHTEHVDKFKTGIFSPVATQAEHKRRFDLKSPQSKGP